MNTLTILALSSSHSLLVIVVLLLLFGGKKIPELMKGLGSGINEFKKGMKGEEDKKEPTSQDKTDNTAN